LARIESQAVAGYYPTPADQVPRIAALLTTDADDDEVLARSGITALDPCAGDGTALVEILRTLSGPLFDATERVRAAARVADLAKSRQELAAFEQVLADKIASGAPLPSRLSSEHPEVYKISTLKRRIEGLEGERTSPRTELPGSIYTCEMEEGRHKVLSERPELGYRGRSAALHGDCFCVEFSGSGVALLYLNSPYDTDKVVGRLEEKFLRRFTEALSGGGILVFVVPYYALASSANTLATHYEDLGCYRFAGEGFSVFKQVVLFARKLEAPRQEADAEILAQVELWSRSGAECPELPEADRPHRRPRYVVPLDREDSRGFDVWKVRSLDVKAIIAQHQPWRETDRRGQGLPVSAVMPAFKLVDVMHRTYEVATPPRPAHIAAGLAAGLFNGQRIEPDDPESPLPPLLVKGVFDREWRTVEEKINKDGDKTGEVQVQAPRLVVTILDLRGHTYHTLTQDAGATGATVASMLTVGDLLASYGRSLMRVMDRQCVVLYDKRRDADRFTLCPSARKLFLAQEHAAKALLTVLTDRGELRQPLLLGEIGSGKSTTSLVTARSFGARRPLIFCPPHLLDSWKKEVASVFPAADYRVLASASDVDAVASATGDFVVSVLSREAAKLGHRLEGVTGSCPRCGTLLDADAEGRAKKRLRCEARRVRPSNKLGKLGRKLAIRLRTHLTGDSVMMLPLALRRGTIAARFAAVGKPDHQAAAVSYVPPLDLLDEVRLALVEENKKERGNHESMARRALVWALAASGVREADVLSAASALKPEFHDYYHVAESFLLMLPPGGALGAAFQLLEEMPKAGYSYGGGADPVDWFKANYAKMTSAAPLAKDDPEKAPEPEELPEDEEAPEDEEPQKASVPTGAVRIDKVPLWREPSGELRFGAALEPGSLGAVLELLKCLRALATWKEGRRCGEPLYQSVPEPRRYPLAKYILRRHRGTFDFVIIDEAHEAGNSDSAQSQAAFRLTSLRKPSILMTGSIMNGYAESLWAPFQATDKDFQREFPRDALSSFIDRYGYRKRLVSDKEDGKIVAYGTQSDRVERSSKDVGTAPGVLPLFLFKHLLSGAVTLQKADLAIELPPLSQERVSASASGELEESFNKMLKKLLEQIKKDRYSEDGLAGKLFGQLAEIGSYLDRATADVGNGYRDYEVRYPESVGGALVASAMLFPKETVLPKESLMLDVIQREVGEGRNVMVFGWHTELLPRLARLLQERLGCEVPILYADKVATAKRQAWIDKHIVKAKARVMVTNPVCIKTGLNNLVHFATIWQHENPACNPIVDRQSIGRIDRIGQKLPTRVFRAYYGGTLQEKMHDLLMNKVAISTATDGLDPESAMLAAGVEPSSFVTGLSLGKALWAMLEQGGEIEERPTLRVVRGGRRR
jgi:DNA polymerase III delta prime subunit